MKRQNHKVIVWLRVCVLAMFCPAFLWRCATVMNLEGGPIDTLPPVIVSMLPDNFTTNFTASKIYVTFDEFVLLKKVNVVLILSLDLMFQITKLN